MKFGSSPKQENTILPGQIEIIENMPIDPWEKVELLLTKLEIKKAIEFYVVSASWSEELGEAPEHIDLNKVTEIERKINKLGLVCKPLSTVIEKFEYYNTHKLDQDITDLDRDVIYKRERKEIRVACNKKYLDKLEKATIEENDEELGKLYAFPETAIEAYKKTEQGDDRLLNFEDLPENLRNQEWIHFLTFKLSKENWQQELETVKEWARIVRKNSPKIYKEFIDYRQFNFECWLGEEILLSKSKQSEKFKKYVNEKDHELRRYEAKKHTYENTVKEIFGRYVQHLDLDLEELRGKKILDLGCGGGEFVAECIEREITDNIYGLDLELEDLALDDKYKEHFYVASFNDELPIDNCDYIISYGAVFLDDEENGIKVLSNALNSLNDSGEIRIFPIKKAGPDSDLLGIKEEEEITNRILGRLEEDWGIEWELKPIDINVSGRDKDVWLEQVLIIRKNKDY